MELNNYDTKQGRTCLLSCVNNVLHYYDVNIEECILYFLGGGFRYIFNRNLTEEENKFKIHSDIPNAVETFLRRWQIEYVLEKNINDDTGERIIIDNLDKGNPVIIGVKNNMLNYDPEFKLHGHDMGHLVTVIGIDESKDKIKISDGFIPAVHTRKFQGWCSYDSIQRAHSEMKNWSLYLNPETLVNLKERCDQRKLKEMARDALKSSLFELLEGKVQDETYYGVEALRKYCGMFSTDNHYYKNSFADHIYRQNIILKMEGFIDNKCYLLDMLKTLSKDKMNESFAKIKCLLEENINKWSKFCLLLVKISLMNDIEKMITIQEKFKELYVTELEIYRQIANCL